MTIRLLLAVACCCSSVRGAAAGDVRPDESRGPAVFVGGEPAAASSDPALAGWASRTLREVAPPGDRHVIHAYFNACPESPDGRFVLYYTSETPEGERGDLRVLERATGEERVIARGIVTEDAHRAACQQWSDGGKTVVFHDCRDGRWSVIAVDLATGRERTLAEDRQIGFGSATGRLVPVYGCHWNPGPHRDLELIDVATEDRRTTVAVDDVVREYGDWVRESFETTDVSIFFPVVSPDETKVFFKLSRPSGGADFRTNAASLRLGKFVYDLERGRPLRLEPRWGHPSWTPDGTAIFEHGNVAFDVRTGEARRHAPSCFSDHPSVAPDRRTFVTDADVSKRPFGGPGLWAVAVGSMTQDEFVVLHVFDNTRGATSWRRNHPHPAFSADGRRVYFNVNDGPRTRLMVAEADEGAGGDAATRVPVRP